MNPRHKGIFNGRMKKCFGCENSFYVTPSIDLGGAIPKKFCSNACYHAYRRRPDVLKRRFWSKVDANGSCWWWVGAKHYRGYGACSKDYGDTRAHRAAWKYTNGGIPKALGVLHRCNNMLCVNPDHLYLGDQQDNANDAVAAGRRNHGRTPVERLLHPQLSRRLTGRKW